MTDRTEFITDIISTAFEGGINYWADISKGKIREYDDDGPVGEWIAITPTLVEKGIECVKGPSFQVRDDILAAILLGNRNNDAGEIDIEAADVIIQASVFGEIVYS
jgi:hypothetical protein